MEKINSRVIAISHSKEGKLFIFGRGIYVGDEPFTGTKGIFGMPKEELAELHGGEFINPKIVLDDGSVVWGCQAWWGSEEKLDKQYAGWEIIKVPNPNIPETPTPEGRS